MRTTLSGMQESVLFTVRLCFVIVDVGLDVCVPFSFVFLDAIIVNKLSTGVKHFYYTIDRDVLH